MTEQKQNYEPMMVPGGGGQQQNAVLKGVISGRPMFAGVDIQLDAGQKMLGDPGSMMWMEEDVKIETDCQGGCLRATARQCADEHCCMNTFHGPGKVGFGFPLPGDMMAFAVTREQGWILSRGAFIAGTENIDVSARFAGCCAAAFSGEGPFLTKVTLQKEAKGAGMVYAGGFGAITRHDLKAGEVLFVDNGLFFAAHEKQKIQVGFVGGLKSMCCSGEGIVMKFYGPATIFTQNRDPDLFRTPRPSSDQMQ